LAADRNEERTAQDARRAGDDGAVGRHDGDADDLPRVPANFPAALDLEEAGGGCTGAAEFLDDVFVRARRGNGEEDGYEKPQ
jgi:hypothetical protein